MITLYDLTPSANAYKVRLMLAFLGLQHKVVPVDVMKGAHKKPEYLVRHPFGLVPVLVDGDEAFWDSHAILVYLAARYGRAWFPEGASEMSGVTAWLSVAANEVHNGPFQARVTKLFGRDYGIGIEHLQKRSLSLLSTIESHLATSQWLALGRPTIADIAVFPAIRLAQDGGIDVSKFAAVTGWLNRFEQLPGFVSLTGAAANPGGPRG